MEDKKAKLAVTDIVLAVLGMLFVLGILFLFGPCGPKEDGTFMTCHWAGNTVKALSVVMLVIALLHLIFKDPKLKAGLSAALLPVAVITLLVPGTLIDLCMMHEMRCHSAMTPAVTVFAILFVIAAACDLILQKKRFAK